MPDYKFYIRPADRNGNPDSAHAAISIEDDGVTRYQYCKGLENMGKVRNAYLEEYPERDGARSFHPSDTDDFKVRRETTAVELSLVLIGPSRRDSFHRWQERFHASRVLYWDTARHRLAFLMLQEAIEVEEDVIKDQGYIIVHFKFTNLWGRTFRCDDSGNALETIDVYDL